MNINELIIIVKNKLESSIVVQELKIEDKSFLHINHKSHEKGKFHLKINIRAKELDKYSKISCNKKNLCNFKSRARKIYSLYSNIIYLVLSLKKI